MARWRTIKAIAAEALPLFKRDESHDHHGIQFYSSENDSLAQDLAHAAHGESWGLIVRKEDDNFDEVEKAINDERRSFYPAEVW